MLVRSRNICGSFDFSSIQKKSARKAKFAAIETQYMRCGPDANHPSELLRPSPNI